MSIFLIEKSEPNNSVNLYKVTIDGQENANLKSLFNTLKHDFNFPNYFSENFNSLDECLNDLSWFEDNPSFLLEINNYNQLLKNEAPWVLHIFLDTLHTINLNYYDSKSDQKFIIKVDDAKKLIADLKDAKIKIDM